MSGQTPTEENYLKAIFHLSAEGGSVSTNALSKSLNTTPASVTDMIKKLGEKDLVEYQPYKGVTLKPAGQKIALKIIRKHRLWEVFLVKVLDFSWDEIHETAEQLEHIDSPKLVDKLDRFLGYPKFDPHGDPIPSAEGVFESRKTYLLAEAETGKKYSVAGVLDHSPEFLQYLDRLGLTIGAQLEVAEKLAFAQTIAVKTSEKELLIPGEIAMHVLLVEVLP